MTEKEAITRLRELEDIDDREAAHIEADEILCHFLRLHGYGAVVEEWEKLHKWYA